MVEVVRPALLRPGLGYLHWNAEGKERLSGDMVPSLKDDDWFTMMLRASETGLVDDGTGRRPQGDEPTV